MKKIKFSFAIHDHQPIGNFEFIFRNAHNKCYLPFLELLEKYPFFRISLHFSGILIEWIRDNQPKTFDLIRRLVQRGQVEMMGGAFYEPILSVIPDEDKIGQIRKLSQFIRDEFKYDVCGMWLAERVWEPHLPKPIAEAGIKYTVLDDTHFRYSGLKDEHLLGYYITEEEGCKISLLPGSKTLRYNIPFKEPEETINYLKSIADEDGKNLIVYADDGEKFGLWPGTYEHCYQDRWIEKFFEEIEKNLDWIEMIHLREALDKIPPLGRIYLPVASYEEMMQWALPAEVFEEYEDFEKILKEKQLFEKYQVFLRGGYWRNFLSKYPESNQIHKKMLWIKKKIKKIKPSSKTQKEKLDQAQDFLWKGECNCPYWHGVFGGLYLPHLRSAIYQNLIQAERILDDLTHNNKDWIDYEIFDFDKDGSDEIIIESPKLNLYFHPYCGGALYELDYKPKSFNLLDILSRRREGYHRKLLELKGNTNKNNQVESIHDIFVAKEDGLEKLLNYDWYRRGSLIDHFLGENTKLEDFSKSKYGEQGDFVNQPFVPKIEKQKSKITLNLKRDGFVWSGENRIPIGLEKKIKISSKTSELDIVYNLTNNSDREIGLWFGIEFNFGMLSGEDIKRYYYVLGQKPENSKLNSVGQSQDIKEFGIKDEHLGLDINLKIDKPADLWRFPIQTISLSESGFEKNYQSSVLLPNWKIKLLPKEIWEVSIIQKISSL
jgi:4-alpha-glucanotransferase